MTGDAFSRLHHLPLNRIAKRSRNYISGIILSYLRYYLKDSYNISIIDEEKPLGFQLFTLLFQYTFGNYQYTFGKYRRQLREVLIHFWEVSLHFWEVVRPLPFVRSVGKSSPPKLLRMCLRMPCARIAQRVGDK